MLMPIMGASSDLPQPSQTTWDFFIQIQESLSQYHTPPRTLYHDYLFRKENHASPLAMRSLSWVGFIRDMMANQK